MRVEAWAEIAGQGLNIPFRISAVKLNRAVVGSDNLNDDNYKTKETEGQLTKATEARYLGYHDRA